MFDLEKGKPDKWHKIHPPLKKKIQIHGVFYPNTNGVKKTGFIFRGSDGCEDPKPTTSSSDGLNSHGFKDWLRI